MELEVGQYIRTETGKIAKIVDKRDISGSIHREHLVWVLDDTSILALNSQKVIKASHNIIDLIEEGDYVNGVRVYVNDKEQGILGENDVFYKEEHIKSVVTKEQFESMSYKIKE